MRYAGNQNEIFAVETVREFEIWGIADDGDDHVSLPVAIFASTANASENERLTIAKENLSYILEMHRQGITLSNVEFANRSDCDCVKDPMKFDIKTNDRYVEKVVSNRNDSCNQIGVVLAETLRELRLIDNETIELDR